METAGLSSVFRGGRAVAVEPGSRFSAQPVAGRYCALLENPRNVASTALPLLSLTRCRSGRAGPKIAMRGIISRSRMKSSGRPATNIPEHSCLAE